MKKVKQSMILTLLLSMISWVSGDRVWFNDNTDTQLDIDQDYNDHNVFIVNGTTVTMNDGAITAPSKTDDGEDAIRVEDATFIANNGTIKGGIEIGGTGVTISTTRGSDTPGIATFNDGVVVYGGDATRVDTTKAGDAVQILQSGSRATFNGGRFVPGTGCTIKTCGVETDNGNAIQIIQGEAIIYGGAFEGNIYNLGGDVEVHGCVEYDEEASTITGTLFDGSYIDVKYVQPNGQDRQPSIVYLEEVCPKEETESVPASDTSGSMLVTLTASVYVSLGFLFGTVSIR